MFAGQNTTTEFLARWVFERDPGGHQAGRLGPGRKASPASRSTIGESHVAWAGYEDAVG